MIQVYVAEDNIVIDYKDQSFSTFYTEEKLKKAQKIESDFDKVKSKKDLDKLLKRAEELCENDFNEKVQSEYKDLYVDVNGYYFLKIGKNIHPTPMPKLLVDLIKESIDKKVSADPIIKMWIRLLRNPRVREELSYNDTTLIDKFIDYISMTYVDPKKKNELMLEKGLNDEIASKLATTREVNITKEGLIGCYKTSDELLTKWEYNEETGEKKKVEMHNLTKRTFNALTGEFDLEELGKLEDIKAEDRVFYPHVMGLEGGTPWTCKGPDGFGDKPVHFYKVGCTHRLAEGNYSASDKMNASFYTGGLSFISIWPGADIHHCLVDPMNITGILDYQGAYACKTKEFYIDGSLTAVNHNIYHSSDYAKQTDAEWDGMKKEILDDVKKNTEEINKNVEDYKKNVEDYTSDL